MQHAKGELSTAESMSSSSPEGQYRTDGARMRKVFNNIGPVILVVLAMGFPLNAIAAPGQLSVTTTPHTDVYLDGKRIGRSPISQVAVAAGQHAIKYKQKGSQFEFVLNIKSGKHYICTFNFDKGESRCATESAIETKSHAYLNLKADIEADVYVNGSESSFWA